MKDFIGDKKDKISVVDSKTKLPYFYIFSNFFKLIVSYLAFNAIISVFDLENWYLSKENESSVFYLLIRNIYLITTKLSTYSWVLLSAITYFSYSILFDCFVFLIDLGIVDCLKLTFSSLSLFGSCYIYLKYILNIYDTISAYNLILYSFITVFLLASSFYSFSKSIIYENGLKKIMKQLIDDFLGLSFPTLSITYIYTIVVVIISIVLASIISVFDLLTLKILTKFIFPWVGNNE